MSTQVSPFDVIGISIRTTNENMQSMEEIPALWEKFFKEDIPSKIPHKNSPIIYAVYHEYEKDYTKPYTLTIGCQVSNTSDIPSGMKHVKVPGGCFTKFTAQGSLENGENNAVYQEWLHIYQHDDIRTYTTDFEVYDERASDPSAAQVDIMIASK